MLSRQLEEFTLQISTLLQEQEKQSSLKQKASGPTTIDINISYSNNNIQGETLDSYSVIADPESLKDLLQDIATSVRDEVEGYSNPSHGSIAIN